jgi:hypothetical protein
MKSSRIMYLDIFDFEIDVLEYFRVMCYALENIQNNKTSCKDYW